MSSSNGDQDQAIQPPDRQEQIAPMNAIDESATAAPSNTDTPSSSATNGHPGALSNGDQHAGEGAPLDEFGNRNTAPGQTGPENAGYNITDNESEASNLKHVFPFLSATRHQNTPNTTGSPVTQAYDTNGHRGSSMSPPAIPLETSGGPRSPEELDFGSQANLGNGTNGYSPSTSVAHSADEPISPAPVAEESFFYIPDTGSPDPTPESRIHTPVSTAESADQVGPQEQDSGQAAERTIQSDQVPNLGTAVPEHSPEPIEPRDVDQDSQVSDTSTPTTDGSSGVGGVNTPGGDGDNTFDGDGNGGGDAAATSSTSAGHGSAQSQSHEPGSSAQSGTRADPAGSTQQPYASPGPSQPTSQRPGSRSSLNPIAPVFVPGPTPSGTSREFILPTWQPDSEVEVCPICGARFSMFHRRHHCRKCGRVVCDRCSPHRITIPHPYIVRPPGDWGPAPQYTYPGVERSIVDFSSIGGGERVRLCNPCVPDPNTAPPPSQSSPRPVIMDERTSRARPPSNSLGNLGLASPSYPHPSQHYNLSRNRSATTAAGQGQGQQYLSFIPYSSTSGQYPPPNTYFTPSQLHQRRVSSGGPRYTAHIEPFSVIPGSSSSSSPFSGLNRPLPRPPAPEREIPDEDACPVCHSELPSRRLSNWEVLRESHINNCITSHSSYGTSQPRLTLGPGSHGTPPPKTTRRTRMFSYVATEKDSVGEVECTICLEEFKAGDQMARLECFCRFHRSCIDSWFVNHPGRCPIHQHDSFGY